MVGEYVLKVYTDGSYKHSTGVGGWAFVVAEDGKVLYKEYGKFDKSTSNRMEIVAVIKALNHLENFSKAIIFSDSKYVLNTIKGKFQRRVNNDLWVRLFHLKTMHPLVEFKWVRGHNGNKFNEMADKLASS